MYCVSKANSSLLQVKPIKCIVISISMTMEKVLVNAADITHVQKLSKVFVVSWPYT
jgi:hypothetical protein